MTQEQKKFIERVGALAAADMQKSGVLASLTIAQAILESGWGKSGLTVKGNALFGIKAGTSWTGAVYSGKTQECYDGVTFTTVTGLFRAYGSWAESVADHSDLLSRNARYKAVIGERDYKAACRAIAAAGYATDPKYADKLVQIIETYALTAYDGAGSAAKPGGSNTTAGTTSPADAKGAGKMKASEFINKLQNIVDNYKTLYVMGCFGAPLTGANVSRYCTNHRYNKQATRTAMIRAAADKTPPVYGFDCVCLIKGVLWGWSGNAAKPYGGAAYASNGVPDLGADTMITKCSGVSADFSGIVPGEAVWLPGHIGVYIGGGKVIECSPAFKNCVQVTACLNIGAISGMNGRKWTKHGKLPYITYDTAGGAQDGAGSTTKPSGTTTTPATLAFAVGDVVRFTGNTHYTNAAAASGAACKPGTAKVTAIAKGTKHPYHLIKQPGGGSTVYGWVNAADVQAVGNGTTAPKMRVGAKVKYSGPLYRDSNGGGQGKTVNGTYTVRYYYPGRKCGVHIDGLGWVNVLTFLAKNWDSVLVVVAFLAVVVVLIKRGETKILKQILFNLVTQAEKQFGSGTGSLKYAAVADWIYQRIPAVLKLLFTSSDIEKMIEAALEEAKKAWGANENLKGYIDTPSVESLLVGIEEQAIQTEPAEN